MAFTTLSEAAPKNMLILKIKGQNQIKVGNFVVKLWCDKPCFLVAEKGLCLDTSGDLDVVHSPDVSGVRWVPQTVAPDH